MYAPYGPFFALITEILPANVAGGAIALINSFGALGSFAGTYFVGKLRGRQRQLPQRLYLHGRLAPARRPPRNDPSAPHYRLIILSLMISAITFSRKL